MATYRLTSIPVMIAVTAAIVASVGYFGLYRPLHEEQVRNQANLRRDELIVDFQRLKTEMGAAQKVCLKKVDGLIAKALPGGLYGASGAPPAATLAHLKLPFAFVPYVNMLTTPPPGIDGGRVCTPRFRPPLAPDVPWSEPELDLDLRRAAIDHTRQDLKELEPPAQFAVMHGRCLSDRHCYGTTAWISGDGQLAGVLSVNVPVEATRPLDDGYRLLGPATDAQLAKL